jgi:hypothetical protein
VLEATEKNRHEVYTEKSEYIFIICEENLEEYHNIKISNTYFVRAYPKRNQNCIHK